MSKRKQMVAFIISKIIFRLKNNNDELTHRARKIKTFHTIETKWGIRICCQIRILKLCSHIEKVRESMFKTDVQCSDQCSKYFKIFPVSKSYYSNQQDSN